MKNKIIVHAMSALIVITFLSSCQSSSEKVENAKNNLSEAKESVKEAKQDLVNTRLDSIVDYQTFKKESELVIAANEKNIASLKAKILNATITNKDNYEKSILKLEKKNNELKLKLKNYNGEGDVKWDLFKAEFNHDLKELSKAFNDVSIKNIK